MKKFAIFIAVFFSLLYPVFCQEMPSDVPPDHYAYDSIADLVDRGINVSQGYPDGTFRGNKNTSRYENAYFMASLALSLRDTASVEVDFSDIGEEISYLRNDIISVQQEQGAKGAMDYYGSVELKSEFGSVFSYNQDHRNPLGPETNYRLQYTIEKDMGDDASIKLNLDTMDGAFNSPTLRTFATTLLDFEGDLGGYRTCQSGEHNGYFWPRKCSAQGYERRGSKRRLHVLFKTPSFFYCGDRNGRQ